MRALGDELQKRLGQPIIVENRSGGGMNIAGRACAEAPNDGYNICILPNEVLTLNEFTFKSIPYNPEKDFDPITNAFINTQVLVVSSALGVKSLDELAALSKAKPGTLSYSVLAIPMQITFENWKKKTGADIVMVPSRGGSDMVTGLLTGTVPVSIVGLPNFIPHIRNGTVKAIAVDSETRSPLFPDVPTLKELGFPNLAPVYFGFVAPAGTPKDVIQKLHDEIVAIGNEPSFRQKRLVDIGIVPVFDTPGAFRGLSEGAARQRPEADPGVRFPAAVAPVRGRHDAAGGLLARQEWLQRPLDRAEQVRVAVLPPSVQVCVPLSWALRRTKVPLYFASYWRVSSFHEPCSSMFWPLTCRRPSPPPSDRLSRNRTTWLYRAAPPAIVTSMASRIVVLVNGSFSHTSVPR